MRVIFKLCLVLCGLLVVSLMIARGAAWLRESETVITALPDGVTRHATPSGVVATMAWGDPGAPPVLLIHGTGAWSGLWAETGKALGEAGFYAVAMDLPPFGFSDRDPDAAYDRGSQAQRIVDLAKTLPSPPVLVAHSFGAAAGAEALVSTPAAFRGGVIVNGAVGLGKRPDAGKVPLVLRPDWVREVVLSATATNPLATQFLLRSLVYNKEAANQAYVDILQEPMHLQGSTPAFADWLAAFFMPEGAVRSTQVQPYADLNIPVRVIWGAEDHITPVDQAWALSAAVAQSEPVILPDVGHIPQIEAPLAFQTALIAVLNGITGR